MATRDALCAVPYCERSGEQIVADRWICSEHLSIRVRIEPELRCHRCMQRMTDPLNVGEFVTECVRCGVPYRFSTRDGMQAYADAQEMLYRQSIGESASRRRAQQSLEAHQRNQERVIAARQRDEERVIAARDRALEAFNLRDRANAARVQAALAEERQRLLDREFRHPASSGGRSEQEGEVLALQLAERRRRRRLELAERHARILAEMQAAGMEPPKPTAQKAGAEIVGVRRRKVVIED